MVALCHRVYLHLRVEMFCNSSDTIYDLKVKVETMLGFPAPMIKLCYIGSYHHPLDPDLEYWDKNAKWNPDTDKLGTYLDDSAWPDSPLSFYLKLLDPSVVRSAFEAATKVTAMKAKPMQGMDGLPRKGKPMKAKSIKAKSMEAKSMKAKSMKAKT